MLLKVKEMHWMAGRPIAILHKDTAEKLNIHVDDRVKIKKKQRETIAVIDLAEGLLGNDEIFLSQEVIDYLHLKKNDLVEVAFTFKPFSTNIIRKKLNFGVLNKDEIKMVIKDIVNNALTEAEIAFFVSAVYSCGMSIQETISMTESIVETGKKLNFKGIVVDKHSIGGVPGNRTTPIVVSICAAAGLKMPKTSSRAITSAAGTADTIETLADVKFSIGELQKIVQAAGACLAWGGSLGLAPADDKIIQVERLLHLDPEPQLLASIMAKKISVGATHVLIDIPYGDGAKVDKKKAEDLKNKFEKIAKYFHIKLKCLLTDGSRPIGRGIGPVLEMREILSILRQEEERSFDLEEKSLVLATEIFNLVGKKNSRKLAEKILRSGKALEKFKEIIILQKGNFSKSLVPGRFKSAIKAGKSGKVVYDCKKLNLLARAAGCPADKSSGLYLHKEGNGKIEKGEVIMEIYAESQHRLKDALNFYNKNGGVSVV